MKWERIAICDMESSRGDMVTWTNSEVSFLKFQDSGIYSSENYVRKYIAESYSYY